MTDPIKLAIEALAEPAPESQADMLREIKALKAEKDRAMAETKQAYADRAKTAGELLALKEERDAWIHENAPGGWIDALRKDAALLKWCESNSKDMGGYFELRTCEHRNYIRGRCFSIAQCTDADKYHPLPFIQLYKVTK